MIIIPKHDTNDNLSHLIEKNASVGGFCKKDFSRNRFEVNQYAAVIPSKIPRFHELFPKGIGAHARRRLKIILPWAFRTFISKTGESKTVQLHSHNDLRKIFGEESLGEKLAELLLNVVNENYLFGKYGQVCKTYTLNDELFDFLCLEMGFTEYTLVDLVVQELLAKHRTELLSGEFAYSFAKESDFKFRTYSPLQNIKKPIREKLFASVGYKIELDIVNCAPTLIYELAKRKNLDCFMDESIHSFIANPEAWRIRIAARNRVSIPTIKFLMNMLIHGGEINQHTDFYKEQLNESIYLLRKLRSDESIMSVKKQFRRLTRLLKLYATENHHELFYLNGTPIKRNTGQIACILYQSEEKRIRDFLINYFQSNGMKVFQIHDGFYLDKEIDENKLEQKIKAELGINIKLKAKFLQ